ncbi:hypothetical protein AK812_SmicGene29969 [Symbiodinium microadriaticum]|uniref:Uncharacterized protein n=1 Tax=Symbiodinium microadriaticum TaxID=2951 RepID=A0A1Q9D0H5_SYMMI|nr:hypothetical protein AK812_SmicGene29969 [Symbiodinium microadriaticum]
MGFSWSSCIAQAATLACCVEAGVCTSSFMDLDSPPPSGPEICGVATDDTFFFHFDKELGRKRLSDLDAVLAANGMPKNATKDVSLQSSMTALGCCIDEETGTAQPEPSKITALFLAWIDLLNKGHASPRSVSRALGLHQWFCLLQRPAFCVFDAVYEFVRREPSFVSADLPSSVGAELAVAAFIMPLLCADLRRTFLPQLTACDAAPAFGFGVAYMRCSRAAAAEVGALAERRGDYVKFYLGFKVAISARARYKAHSGEILPEARHAGIGCEGSILPVSLRLLMLNACIAGMNFLAELLQEGTDAGDAEIPRAEVEPDVFEGFRSRLQILQPSYDSHS